MLLAQNVPVLGTTEEPNADDSLIILEHILKNLLYLALGVNTVNTSSSPEQTPQKARPQSLSPKKSSTSLPLSGSSDSNLPHHNAFERSENKFRGSKKEVVSNFLASSAGKSLVIAWELFKKYYLRILLPATSRRVGMVVDDREGCILFKPGFPAVPVKILFALIEFIVRNCLPAPSGRILDSSLVLNAVIFGAYDSRELVHELIRQALLLPYADLEISKGAIHILRTWISQNAEERPTFLHETEIATSPAGKIEINMNAWLRRYVKMLKMIFLERADRTNTPNQIVLFKEALNLFKMIALEVHVQLMPKTWETLLISLLEIQNLLMNAYPNKSAIVISLLAAEDIADMLVETLLCCWVRAATTSEQLWKQLRVQLKKSTTWSQTILQWSVCSFLI